MKRKNHFPAVDPLFVDLALLITVSIGMSVVFITAAYMVYLQFTGI